MIKMYKKAKIGAIIGLILGLVASISFFISKDITKEIEVDRKAFNEKINTETHLAEEDIREKFKDALEQEKQQEIEMAKNKNLIDFGIGKNGPVAKELEKKLREIARNEDQSYVEFHSPSEKKARVLNTLVLVLTMPGVFIVSIILSIVSLGKIEDALFTALFLAGYYVWIIYPILGFIIGFLLDKFFFRRRCE
jgi:preprotein translocase subunit SecF